MARTKLTDLYKSLYDIPLHEQMSPETLMVKLGGDEKTELKIFNQMDSTGAVDLSNITLEFKGEKYEGLEFKLEDILEDHVNEGKDALFVAESDDKKFEVEVNIQADYDMSGIIDDVEWRSLETFPKEVSEQGPRPDYADVDGDGDEEESMEKAFKDKEKIDEDGCTEQEIEEGTCGYAPDGDIDPYITDELEPAGTQLFILDEEKPKLQESKMINRFKKLANIK